MFKTPKAELYAFRTLSNIKIPWTLTHILREAQLINKNGLK